MKIFFVIGLSFLLWVVAFADRTTFKPKETETSFVVTTSDLNQNSTLFGGKILAEMDKASAIEMRRLIKPEFTYATIAVKEVKFLKTASVKDMITVTARATSFTKSTVCFSVTVERETVGNLGRTLQIIAEGEFIFVALQDGKSVEHGLAP